MALVATGGLLGSQLIVGIIPLYDPTFMPKRWHQFLVYIGYNIFAMLLNAFGNSILPYVNQAAIFWSISGFVIICITVLACATPDYNTGDTVFRLFLNETGWPDGVAWLLGLLQGGLGLTGYDATAHMIEEIPNAAVEGPKIMIYCVAIGTFTGFVFLMCLLFVAGPFEKVIKSPAGPLGQILFNATNSKAGTVCLLIFPLVCLLFATTSIMTTSSRMNYGKLSPFPFEFILYNILNSHTTSIRSRRWPPILKNIRPSAQETGRPTRILSSHRRRRRGLWLHLPRLHQRLQRHRLRFRRISRFVLRYSRRHQHIAWPPHAPQEPRLRPARMVRLVRQHPRRRLRHHHHSPVRLPARPARVGKQHELLHRRLRHRLHHQHDPMVRRWQEELQGPQDRYRRSCPHGGAESP